MVIFGNQGEGLNVSPVAGTKSQVIRNHSMIELDSLFKDAGVIRYPNGYRMIGLTLQNHLDGSIVSGFASVIVEDNHPNPRSIIIPAKGSQVIYQRFQEEDLSILQNVVYIFGIILVSSGIGHIVEGNVKGLVIMPETSFIDEIIIGENQNRLRRTPVIR